MFRIIFFILILLLTAACVIFPNTIRLQASRQINPDALHRPLPVLVRAYGLTDPEIFSEASFRQIWEHDQKTLGNTLVNRSERTLMPGSISTIQLSRDPNIRYIAVMAIFRSPTHDRWRIITKKPVWGSVSVRLTGNRITLQKS